MRHRFRFAVGLVLCLGPLVSCGGGSGKLDLTLRSRDILSSDPPPGCPFYLDQRHAETTTRCVLHRPELRWVAGDGQLATLLARTSEIYFSSTLHDPVDCNGHRPPGNFTWFKWSSPTDSPVDFDRLTMYDGNELALYGDRGMAVHDGIEITCSESSGRWRGTAGKLLGHEGTYTRVYDSVQIVLHLVED